MSLGHVGDEQKSLSDSQLKFICSQAVNSIIRCPRLEHQQDTPKEEKVSCIVCGRFDRYDSKL